MKTNNAKQFSNGTILYFRLMGFDLENKNNRMKLIFTAALVNLVFVILGLSLYFGLCDIDIHEKTHAFLFIIYNVVSLAHITTLICNRRTILEVFNVFRATHPVKELEKAYNLQVHVKQYKLIENILVGFFCTAMCVYCFQPLIGSFIHLIIGGKFTFHLSYRVWYGFEIPKENVFYYILMYISQVWSIHVAASIVLGMDLCIFSSIIQLNMQFDIIRKNILHIEPDKTNKAARKLMKEIGSHQRCIRLAEKINTVFTPPVLFSLLSSSLILCFTGFQLLGELSLIIIVKAVFLLAYEMKHIAITCYLGDKLIEISLKISDALYEHHSWYNGTPKYRRLVLMVLMRSQQSVALQIAGISDISLQTLRRVMSASYQIFTLLKSR